MYFIQQLKRLDKEKQISIIFFQRHELIAIDLLVRAEVLLDRNQMNEWLTIIQIPFIYHFILLILNCIWHFISKWLLAVETWHSVMPEMPNND